MRKVSKRLFKYSIYVILCILCIAMVTANEQITFLPASLQGNMTNTWITSEDPNSNYRTSTFLIYAETAFHKYGFLMNWNYTCDSLPPDGRTWNDLNWIKMQVYAHRTEVDKIPLYPMNHSWDENTVTYNNCGNTRCDGWFNTTWNITVNNTPMVEFFNLTLNNTWLEWECSKPADERYGLFAYVPEAGPTNNNVLRSGYYGANHSWPTLIMEWQNATTPSPPQPDVNITYPPNNTLSRDDPFNVSFLFANFNATNCTLYANTTATGDYEQRASISTGAVNITEYYNITQEFINLSDKYALYRFEEGSGTTAIDLIDGNNGTISGGYYNESKIGNGTGNYSINLSTAFVSIPNQDYLDFGTTNDFSISAWVQTDIIDSNYHMIFDTRDAGGDGVFFSIATGNIFQLVVNSVSMSTVAVIPDKGWHFLVATVDRDDAGNTDIWINGVSQSVGQVTNTQNVNTLLPAFIGRRSFSAGVYWEGRIDEFTIWNKSLTQDNIDELYDEGVIYYNITTLENSTIINQTLNESTNYTFSIPVEDPETSKVVEYYVNCYNGDDVNSSLFISEWDADFDAPDITVLFPDTTYNETYPFDMYINVSIDEVGTCTVNNTAFSLTTFNDTYFSFSEFTLNNSFYAVEVNCSDDSVVPNSNTTVVWFTKDKQFPYITNYWPSASNSTSEVNDGLINLLFNTSDNRDLYSIWVNITYDKQFFGETLIYSDFVNVSGTSYFYDELINTLNWSNATYTEKIRVCDSHTNNKIKDARAIVKEKKNIKFELEGNTQIHIKSKDSSTATDYKKLDDRYTFTFKYDDVILNKKFEIWSNKDIVYRANSYKGHFIIDNTYWLDFEQEGDVLVEEVCEDNADNETECKYIITVVNSNKEITFNSIGELNCLTEHYTFSLLSETESAYSIGLLSGNKWFNYDVLKTDTTAGVLLYIFLFMILVAMILLGEMTQIPIIMMLSSIYGVFFGILLYAQLSAIMGFIFIILSIFYFVRSGLATKG